MVEDRLADGTRIAQLLASEVEGHDSALADVRVVDANPDVEATPEGALAYRVAREGEPLASVYVQPDRARLEVDAAPEVAARAAADRGLRVRPAASDPPRTLVFVEDGAEVKRAFAVLEAVASEVGQ